MNTRLPTCPGTGTGIYLHVCQHDHRVADANHAPSNALQLYQYTVCGTTINIQIHVERISILDNQRDSQDTRIDTRVEPHHPLCFCPRPPWPAPCLGAHDTRPYHHSVLELLEASTYHLHLLRTLLVSASHTPRSTHGWCMHASTGKLASVGQPYGAAHQDCARSPHKQLIVCQTVAAQQCDQPSDRTATGSPAQRCKLPSGSQPHDDRPRRLSFPLTCHLTPNSAGHT